MFCDVAWCDVMWYGVVRCSAVSYALVRWHTHLRSLSLGFTFKVCGIHMSVNACIWAREGGVDGHDKAAFLYFFAFFGAC